MNSIKDIWDVNYAHPYINARDSRLKMCDHINQVQSEWKVAELSAKRMGTVLHKVFEAF